MERILEIHRQETCLMLVFEMEISCFNTRNPFPRCLLGEKGKKFVLVMFCATNMKKQRCL